MQLLTKTLTEKIPKLYETEGLEAKDKIAQVKLFLPGTACTWYVVEFDGKDTCFGLVDLGYEQDVEFGYFSLKELSEQRSLYGLGIERDIYFEPSVFDNIRT
jgi:hypothetical protein